MIELCLEVETTSFMVGSWEMRVDFKEDFKESWQGLSVEF